MINLNKLLKMARKWQKVAAMRRKRISLPRTNKNVCAENCSASILMADKGHFVVYTVDQKRFVVPLKCLSNEIFRELFRMSEEEFGLPTDGPITFPCDAYFMEHILSLIQQDAVRGLEKALIMLVASSRCASSSSQPWQTNQQLLVY